MVSNTLDHSNYLVLGAGLSGSGASKLLHTFGKQVSLYNDFDLAKNQAAQILASMGVRIYVGDPAAIDLPSHDAMVVSPMWSEEHPLVRQARALGIPIFDEIEIAWEASGDAEAICITGTNGKSTTTRLVEHILRATGRPFAQAVGKRGLIKNVYTDNVDNIFSLCGVKFERTRGLGIFNDPFPIRTAGLRTLIAIGVAADRRSIISEARKSGCRIVVVNPMRPVSPRSQNLSYLQPHDLWYRMEASEFCDLHGSWLNSDHS